jgi:hypothetical protein
MASSSDLTAYRKTGLLLCEINKLQPVLTSNQYTEFTRFNLENNIVNNKQISSQLHYPGYKNIVGMEFPSQEYPEFILCRQTNTRLNRKTLLQPQIQPHPSRPVYLKK